MYESRKIGFTFRCEAREDRFHFPFQRKRGSVSLSVSKDEREDGDERARDDELVRVVEWDGQRGPPGCGAGTLADCVGDQGKFEGGEGGGGAGANDAAEPRPGSAKSGNEPDVPS